MPKLVEVSADTKAIAKGLFEALIDDHRTLLAFGMIDISIDQAVDSQLHAKYDRLVLERYKQTPEELDKYIAGCCKEIGLGVEPDDFGLSVPAVEQRSAWVKAMKKQILTDLYGAASAAGAMVV